MLKLIPAAGDAFDLAFDDPAVDDADAAAATVLYAELYTDTEAPAGRVADRFDRRGWFYRPSAGVNLWYVRRQPLDDKARRETIDGLADRISSRDPAFTGVTVSETPAATTAGNVSSVLLEITGFHNGRKFIVRAPL